MTRPDFTRDELLAFLDVADAPPDDMLTSREWETRLGISRPMMARVLEAAKARGVLRVGKARREAIDGRNALVSVYGFEMEAK